MTTLTYTFTCDRCHAVSETRYPIGFGWNVKSPRAPDGWVYLENIDTLLCPKHSYVIEIKDGQCQE